MFSSAVATSHIASSRTDRARGNMVKNAIKIMTDPIFKHLRTRRSPFYLKALVVPRSKQLPPRL